MREQIPNLITGIRILAIAPICWLLWQGHYGWALLLLVLAGLSDALDGFLARRYGWFTPLGAMLDPLADKLFVIAIFVVFGLKGSLPWWLIALVIGRDVVIVSGALAYLAFVGNLQMRPLYISKLNTGLQITLLAATLLHVAIQPLPAWLTHGLQWTVAATTILSGAAYVWLWGSDAIQKRQGWQQ